MRTHTAAALLATLCSLGAPGHAETLLDLTETLPPYLRDRGQGIPTSMFGTYLEAGQLMVYPFYEYYWNHDEVYNPEDLGYGLNRDFKGRYVANEGLIFLGYGVSDRLVVELEAAVISAELTKDPADPTAQPTRIKESGLGDVEGQLRYRFSRENERRPETFGYFETVFPLQKDKRIIGTQGWELKLGVGAIKGFGFGTLTARASAEYDEGEGKVEVGEFALEYLRKLSPRWRAHLGVEGVPGEIEGIAEVQYHFSRNAFLKLNNSVGLTPEAKDYAPEVGIALLF